MIAILHWTLARLIGMTVRVSLSRSVSQLPLTQGVNQKKVSLFGCTILQALCL